MATVKKGILTHCGGYWKHLHWMKRVFWKGERKAAERDIRDRIEDEVNAPSIDQEIEWIVDYHGFDR